MLPQREEQSKVSFPCTFSCKLCVLDHSLNYVTILSWCFSLNQSKESVALQRKNVLFVKFSVADNNVSSRLFLNTLHITYKFTYFWNLHYKMMQLESPRKQNSMLSKIVIFTMRCTLLLLKILNEKFCNLLANKEQNSD